ncbi:uncharacterized protein LOC144180197 [Haemaphysalis longicornis]
MQQFSSVRLIANCFIIRRDSSDSCITLCVVVVAFIVIAAIILGLVLGPLKGGGGGGDNIGPSTYGAAPAPTSTTAAAIQRKSPDTSSPTTISSTPPSTTTRHATTIPTTSRTATTTVTTTGPATTIPTTTRTVTTTRPTTRRTTTIPTTTRTSTTIPTTTRTATTTRSTTRRATTTPTTTPTATTTRTTTATSTPKLPPSTAASTPSGKVSINRTVPTNFLFCTVGKGLEDTGVITAGWCDYIVYTELEIVGGAIKPVAADKSWDDYRRAIRTSAKSLGGASFSAANPSARNSTLAETRNHLKDLQKMVQSGLLAFGCFNLDSSSAESRQQRQNLGRFYAHSLCMIFLAVLADGAAVLSRKIRVMLTVL